MADRRKNAGQEGLARLSYKRVRPYSKRPPVVFIVDSTCSLCSHKLPLAFAGWTAYTCPECGAELERTPYRAKSPLEQLAAVAKRRA